MRVVDWAERTADADELLGGDGLHLSEQGRLELATQIAGPLLRVAGTGDCLDSEYDDDSRAPDIELGDDGGDDGARQPDKATASAPDPARLRAPDPDPDPDRRAGTGCRATDPEPEPPAPEPIGHSELTDPRRRLTGRPTAPGPRRRSRSAPADGHPDGRRTRLCSAAGRLRA